MSCGNVPDGQGTDEQEEVLMPRRRQVRRVDKSVCQRCQIAKSMYLIRNVTYCKTCFDSALYGRFARLLHPPLKTSPSSAQLNKKVMGNLRPPRQKGGALIALSSGAGSTTMLDILLSRGYLGKGDGKMADKTRGEKEVVWDEAWVVYVEFGGVLDGAEDRMEEVRSWVGERAVGGGRGVGFVGLRAEDVFDPSLKERVRSIAGSELGVDTDNVKESSASESASASGVRSLAVDLKNPDLPFFESPITSTSDATPLSQLRSLLSSLPAASRPSLLSHILNSLIHLVAALLPNISHLLLGETSSRQAQRVISGTALGRGWALPLELSSARREENGLILLRPMKDVSIREAAVYCHLKGYSGFTRNERRWERAGPAGKRDARGKGGVTSLEMLTEQFIASLSVTHPSTVSTIGRTGDKLVFPSEDGQSTLCPVCQLPVDPSALEWKSRTALTSLSTKTPSHSSSPSSSSSPAPTSPDEDELKQSGTLAPLLCYACLTTFTPSTVVSRCQRTVEPSPLPLWVGERISARRRQGEAMREEIKEFLIPQEDE